MKLEEAGAIIRLGGRDGREPSGEAAPRAGIARIAARAARLAPEGGVLVEWRLGADAGVTIEPAESPWRGALERAAAIAERYPPTAVDGAGVTTSPTPVELIETPRRAGGEPGLAVAVRVALGGAVGGRSTLALAAPARHGAAALEAIAALAADAVAAAMRAAAADQSREFWRGRAEETVARLNQSAAAARESDSERKLIDDAAAATTRLRARNRYAGLGAQFASLGPFEAWIVALAEDGAMRAVAAHGALIPAAPLDDPNALAGCVRRGVATVRRLAAARRGAPRPEDRLFARFEAYACVPIEGGAIALAARAPIDDRSLQRAAALAARTAPLLAKWRLQADNERLERLVRTLGMRLYGAVDAERARIARDLHDHQAQLLAAARIALEAGPDEARGIFKQLEDALRLRVRELRPATLGRSTLEDGLRYELRRLADAGIRGRLRHAQRCGALTRPVQQVCYQVAREALANVIRHAAASHVEIAIEKRGRVARLSILDNGRGIRAAPGQGGMGLSGLTERLEMMGGRLKIESKSGATRLIAEIPEPA